MTITITVTKEHLVRAMQADGEYSNICPLAQAFRDVGFPNVWIDENRAYGYVVQLEKGVSGWQSLPENACNIAEAYDSRDVKSVEELLENPITFDMEVSAS